MQPSEMQVPWVGRGMTMGAMSPITSLTFDCSEELLWNSDSYGNVRSFQPLVVQPSNNLEWYAYSSFNYFRHSPCISVVSTPDIVWTAGFDAIRAQKRGGAPVFSIPVPATVQRRIFTMVPDDRTKSVIFHGESPGIMQIFPEASTTNIITTHSDAALLTCMVMTDPYLITGSATGEVTLRDPTSFNPVTRLRGDARVTDVNLAADGHTLIVAAQSTVRLYDTRQLQVPLARFTASTPVAKLTRAAIGDKLFCLQSWGVEVLEPTDLSRIYSMPLAGAADAGACTTMAVSKNGECLVVGTDKGVLNCLSHVSVVESVDPEHAVVIGPFCNTAARKAPVQPTPSFTSNRWRGEDEEPQLDKGFDYNYSGPLASDWPAPHYMILACEEKTLTVPQQLREQFAVPSDNRYGVTKADTFRPNPKDKLSHYIPNPYPFNEQLGDDPTKVGPVLVQLRKQRKSARMTRSNNLAYSKLEESGQVCYAMQQPFDWKAYNQSHNLIGLDNSLRESWINSFLHCLYYLQGPHYSIRKTIMRHVCKRRLCMTCELSALFHNMTTQVANHSIQPIMQPTNLLRTMCQIPRFARNNVFATATGRDDAVAKCHTMVKLVLEQMDDDLRSTAETGEAIGPIMPEYVATVFGTELQLTNSKANIPPRFYWEVPASASKVDEGLQHLLKQLERYRSEPVSIRQLPPVILLLLNPEHGHLRPPPSLKFSRPNEEYNYFIASNIVHLAEDADDPGNFVLHCKVPDPTAGKTANDPWVVFNDYCVSGTVMSEDVLETLIPTSVTHATVVTCYILDAFRGQSRDRRDEPINHFNLAGDLLVDDWSSKELVLYREPSLGPVRPPRITNPITDLRQISPNDIVAIDAEYIILDWGNEPRDEPTWMQRKPHMSLARVSCILSREDGHEQVIIDDYICTTEPVMDYVTAYSGIYEDDLNPKRTPYQLTSLKAAVLKLRCLLDRGVFFLGHGLSQDFRVINLAVPKHRTIDTVELFHRKGHRYLSLRYLAYYLLNERIQDDNHDSIEDARTSLRLYRKYLELFNKGQVESTLDFLFQRGAETNWYIPDPESATPTPQTMQACEDDDTPGNLDSTPITFLSAPVVMSTDAPDVPSSLPDAE